MQVLETIGKGTRQDKWLGEGAQVVEVVEKGHMVVELTGEGPAGGGAGWGKVWWLKSMLRNGSSRWGRRKGRR